MSTDEFVKRLQESDQRTLERRAQRLQELAQIQTDGRLFASQREWDYAGEASESYINGNYRSTVFCCACAVDQILRYEFLKVPGNKYEDIEKCTFGQMIGKCRRVTSLLPFLKEAETLNKLRNDIAAHPIFIDLPTSSNADKEIRNQLVLKDINRLVDLVCLFNEEIRDQIEATKLVSEVEGKTYNFGKVIHGLEEVPFNIDGFWGLLEQDVLRFLANKSWAILKEIAEGLYGVSDSIAIA